MKSREPFTIEKHIRNFIDPRRSVRENFKCVKYTGEYGIATNAVTAIIFPSKVPAMIQNYYTREISNITFPDVSKIMPHEFEYQTTISALAALDLSSAAECVAKLPFNSDMAMSVLSFSDEKIRIRGRHEAITSFSEVFSSQVEGSYSIGIAPQRLSPILRCLVDFAKCGDEISIGCEGKDKPILFATGDMRILLSPIRSEYIDEI